jgi:hypothetical protein
MSAIDKARLDPPDEAYSRLPKSGPYLPKIGSALITMVEPHVGHDHGYNRWYEDDHFNAGAMAFPWMFAGRRWVAPTWLQALRYPDDGPIAQPKEAGKYLSVYWITRGRYVDHIRWAVGTNQRLYADDRVFQERTHTFTAFQYHLGTTYRDAAGSRDVHALDYPYQGLVLEVLTATPGHTRADVDRWVADEYAPPILAGGPAAMVLRFEQIPLPDDKSPYVEDVPGVEGRVTLIWFLDAAPQDVWADRFAGNAARVAADGVATVELVAPFIPTLPGTDRYVDELR